MVRASIIGSTGYTGGELLRWLVRHPKVQITHCTSESYAGKRVSEIHSDLAGSCALTAEKCDPGRIAKDSDVVFLCLPHGDSARMAKSFLDRNVRVIDLSADFRIKSRSLYESWYKVSHPCPEFLKEAVYGLPEIHRARIPGAKLVANPGCYATATILSLAPFISKGVIDGKSVIVDAKSGTSGAGRKLENRYLFCEENENFLAYGVANHRHLPEIEQELNALTKGGKASLTFVPHLLPVNRGILVTAYASLEKNMTDSALRSVAADFYRKEPFVTVLPEGSIPDLRSVQHTNFFRMGVKVDKPNKRAILIGVIDNLAKGASSQAVQNMNLMFGVDETAGLI